MKQLQKDLTTPEQSKRLLELGVPKVTANYYYDSRDFKPQAHEVRGHYNEEDSYAARHGYKITPLWSVGRLIRIVSVCCTDDNVKDEIAIEVMFSNKNSAQLIIEMMSEYAYVMDFSKLEE